MEFIKKGSVVTTKETIDFSVSGLVSDSFYTKNNKKYIDVELSDSDFIRVACMHKESENYLTKKNIQNPLEGNILKIKVPFYRNRVSCKINGDTIIQDYKKGQKFNGVITYCGVWTFGDFCGLSWKLKSVE